MKAKTIPQHLFVAAAGEFEPGLAIGIRFKLKGGESLFFIVFMYGKTLAFTREQLFRTLDRIETLALPARLNLRQEFNGEIEVEPLTEGEIHTAIANYRSCANSWQFPPDYLQCLERALAINPKSDCLVAFETLY